MLATWRSAPDHLSLISVELKSVGSHPPAYVAYAVRNMALELETVTRLTEAVNLSFIGVEIGVQAMCTNQSKQIWGVENRLEASTEVRLEAVVHASAESYDFFRRRSSVSGSTVSNRQKGRAVPEQKAAFYRLKNIRQNLQDCRFC